VLRAPEFSKQMTNRFDALAMVCSQRKRLILNSRFPMPVTSYQRTSARTISPLLK
jgi:hypothetical protein